MKEKKLLVPFDFSEVADSAVEHALVTAKVVGAEVHVLHVVSKKDNIKEAKDKLDAATNKLKAASRAKDVNIVNHVRVGNIFDDIADFSVEIGAELILLPATPFLTPGFALHSFYFQRFFV